MSDQHNLQGGELAVAIARSIDEKKGRDIAVLRVGGLCSFADYFVIATADNANQLRAIDVSLSRDIRAQGARGDHDQIRFDTTWGIVDFGDVIVHLMLEEAREYYGLERLWGDGEAVDWQTEAAKLPPVPARQRRGGDEREEESAGDGAGLG